MGGIFTVKLHEEQEKIAFETPCFTGHKEQLQDMEFSPFDVDLLATASADKTVKLWKMKAGKLENSTEECEATLKDHAKKAMLLKWHPAAGMTLASAGQNDGIRIWDVSAQKAAFSFNTITAEPKCLGWNHNGSLLSVFTKDKMMHVIDPRSQSSVVSKNGHMSISKPPRVQWNGAHNLMISVGFTDKNQREYMVHDPRNWSTPVHQTNLDKGTQICWIHYDDATSLFYVVNKGHGVLQQYFFSETGERTGKPELIQCLNDYVSKEMINYFYFLPKQAVDPMKKEINRGIKLTGKTAEFVSFKVQKKLEPGFSADLFPKHRAAKAAQTYQEWASGANKDPLFEEFQPDGSTSTPGSRGTGPSPAQSSGAPTQAKFEEQKVPDTSPAISGGAQGGKDSELAPNHQADTFFTKRPLLGKPVPACAEALKNAKEGHEKSKTHLNLPQLPNGNLDLHALNTKRAALSAKLKDLEVSWAGWRNYALDCTIDVLNVPVSYGHSLGTPIPSIRLYKIRPKNIRPESKDNVGYVWAHGGGAVYYDAQHFEFLMCRMAVEANCIVFSVDFRNGPEYKSPTGMMDFYHCVKFVSENAAFLGVNKKTICVGGQSGGAWICLGAVHLMIKSGEVGMIKSQILTCPMISNQSGSLPESQLADYEVPNAESIKNFIQHLSTPEDFKQKSAIAFPGLMSDGEVAQCPPTVIFTSEFDYLRRDAIHFAKRLQKAKRYLDLQDMPGTHHGYQYDGNIEETGWFFQEMALAIEKYVRV